jgi:hypothetical protein
MARTGLSISQAADGLWQAGQSGAAEARHARRPAGLAATGDWAW